VAKYTVESSLMSKSESGERQFRVPGGVYTWKDIIATIEEVQGVKYTSHYLAPEDAFAAAKDCERKGDIDGELAFSLKGLMGDPKEFGVPKPWDNHKFPIEPEPLEVAIKRFFAEEKSW
jgi:hypothetical protein